MFKQDQIYKYITSESDEVSKVIFWNRVHLIRLAYSRMIEVVDVLSARHPDERSTILRAQLTDTLTKLNMYHRKFKDESDAFGATCIHFKRRREAHDELIANLRVLLCQRPMNEEIAEGDPVVLSFIRRVNALLEKGSS
jgi:hypothetical protein